MQLLKQAIAQTVIQLVSLVIQATILEDNQAIWRSSDYQISLTKQYIPRDYATNVTVKYKFKI
jgi:hypothetical protein